MPGYMLVEQSELSPPKARGIPAYPQVMGFLDFLREISADECPFSRLAEIRVVGLEEVLYSARPEHEALAADIHLRLRSAASELERHFVNVQVVFRGKLGRGDTLWVEYRGQRLPIGNIFGFLPRQTDARGNTCYKANFGLTNA